MFPMPPGNNTDCKLSPSLDVYSMPTMLMQRDVVTKGGSTNCDKLEFVTTQAHIMKDLHLTRISPESL